MSSKQPKNLNQLLTVILTMLETQQIANRDQEERSSAEKTFLQYFSRKKTFTALSTAEAEFVAMSETGKDIFWFQNVFRDFGCGETFKTTLFGDKCPSLNWTKPMNPKLPNHIALKYFFVKDMVNEEKVSTKHTPSENNISDIFTKPLDTEAHHRHCKSLGMMMWEEC